MQPELLVIDSLEELKRLRAYISGKDLVAYDVETTGITAQDQIIGYALCAEETKAFYVLMARWDVPSQTLVYLNDQNYQNLAKAIVGDLKGKNIIAHNGVFDSMITEANFKIRIIESLHTDTMLLAHTLNENRRVGLKDLGEEYFGESAKAEQIEMKASIVANGGVTTKLNYELYKAESYLIGKYGAKDTWLTLMLFTVLIPELYEQKLDTLFYEECMPLLKGPTYDLNTTGLTIDQKKLIQLKKTLEAEIHEAKDFIYKEIREHVKEKYPGDKKSNQFNIGSSKQLSWLLFGQLGLEFGTLTKGGKTICKTLGLKLPYTFSAKKEFIATCNAAAGAPQQPDAIVNGEKIKAKKVREAWNYIACDKATLTKLAPKYKWIAKLLEYQKKTKLLTTYIKGIENRIKYGIIRPSFLQHGTTSGRYSSRNPNFQNLPRDDKRVKEIIISRPGRVFVGADYSQLEPRVFAYFSNDSRLLEAFRSSDDFYSVIGMEVFNKTDCTPQKEGSPDAFGIKYKRLRDISKVIALSSTYGSTAFKLAPTIGKSVEETQIVIDDYFERFPGVAKFMLDSHKQAKVDGYVSSLFGRKRRMPEALRITKLFGDVPHSELPYEARNLLNLAVNHKVQSTAASIVNRAAIRFYNDCKELGLNVKLTLQVHDSLVAECDEKDAEAVALLLQNAMENTVELQGVKLEAIPKIGITLAEV